MDIVFATDKLAKIMNSGAKLSQAYGPDLAKSIRRRLDELDAAISLDEMRTLPGRCEELTGDRAGKLSVRISANYRLIFQPNHIPVPARADGGLDWTLVTAIEVIEVVDYH